MLAIKAQHTFFAIVYTLSLRLLALQVRFPQKMKTILMYNGNQAWGSFQIYELKSIHTDSNWYVIVHLSMGNPRDMHTKWILTETNVSQSQHSHTAMKFHCQNPILFSTILMLGLCHNVYIAIVGASCVIWSTPVSFLGAWGSTQTGALAYRKWNVL